MSDIDTRVLGDPGSCHAAADWLGKLAKGTHENGTDIHRVITTSESCWEGGAGDAFRKYVKKVSSDSDTISSSTTQAQHALNSFADDLHTVKSRINQARKVAHDAGLTLTSTSIKEPGRKPNRMGPLSLPEALKLQNARAAWDKKAAAFREAQGTVANARKLEQKAHKQLTRPMHESSTILQRALTVSSTVTRTGISAVGTLHSSAKQLFKEADDIAAHAQRMQRIALDTETTEAASAAAQRAADASTKGSQTPRKQGKRIEKPIKKLPEGLKDAITRHPGDTLVGSSGVVKVAKRVLKSVPYAGTLAAIGFEEAEVASGEKTQTQAAAETIFSIAGGAEGAESGAILCAPAGPEASAACGIIGGLIGGFAGQKTGAMITGDH